MTERIAYFDCFSGASGDMILGCLVDAGVAVDDLAADLATLPCGDLIALRAETVRRNGMRATKIHVQTSDGPAPPHRGLGEIRDIIHASSLPATVRERAVRVFTRLAEAEAAVHDVPLEQIHFHEVGGLDAIADIVGVACALERMGITRLLFSTLCVGGGTVKAAHGTLPVPAPATAKLLEGCRIEVGPVRAELLTPTAAAILTALGTQDEPPPFRIDAVGCGAGTHVFPALPNVLRVFIGRTEHDAEADAVWVVEANLDDTTPELCGHALDRLLAAGALDAYVVPIQMKKSRPAFILSAIVGDDALSRVEDVFFRETTTFGLRRTRVARARLRRETLSVSTPYGAVRVKIGTRRGEAISIAPEYEDCRRIAAEHNLPLREVMRLAAEAARQTHTLPPEPG